MTPLDDGIGRRFQRIGKLEDGFDDFPVYFPFSNSDSLISGCKTAAKDNDVQATATQKTFIGLSDFTTSLRSSEISLYSWAEKV